MSTATKVKQPLRVIIGFFDVPGFGPDSVEVPVKGAPREQYAALDVAITKRHPKAKQIRRTGSVIELRGDETADGFIELHEGASIGNVFDNHETGEAEAFKTVGRVFVNGSPNNIVLVLNRATGIVRVQLTPVLKNIGNGPLRYSNQIDQQRLASELPTLLKEIVGSSARNLTLRLRDAKPKPPVA